MPDPDQALAAIAARPEGPRVLDALVAVPGSWIVGGAVRDALLGRPARELDVVVEGDVEPLVAALGGEVVVRHDRFGTATLDLGGAPVDVVRARRETYAAPGALPDVEPGTLEDDLARRDVTVNALALRPGELRGVAGAEDDLARGVLRVLHDASFADDPTRLWRVARYAARLGFAVEGRTAELAARADPTTASGPRHGRELRLALAEPDPLAALASVLAVHSGLLPDGFDAAPARLPAALGLLPPDGRRDLVVLAACCALVDAAALVGWLDALAFSSVERDVVAAGSRAAIGAPLQRAVAPSEVAAAARGVPIEVVALAGGANARRWIDDLRHVALEVTGADLLDAGVPEGPEVGARLRHALDRRLDDPAVRGRDAELAAALEPLPDDRHPGPTG